MQKLSLNSQRIDLSNNIDYVIKRKFKAEKPDREMRNNIFRIYFLNQDIFHNNSPRHLKFGMLKDNGHIEGTIIYLGFSFLFYVI